MGDPELIKCVGEIENNYAIYKSYKKLSIRLAVGFSLAKKFSENVGEGLFVLIMCFHNLGFSLMSVRKTQLSQPQNRTL